MMDGVSLPLRRALALAILLTVLVLGWTLAVAPLIDLSRDRQADIAALSEQLARLRAIIGRQPALERRAASEQGALSAEGGLWTGPSAVEVAAAMQDRLRKVIGGSGGRLRSTAMVGEATEHGFRRVTVHFSLDGTLDTVTATLAAIETAHPGMFVDLMAVHAAVAAVADRAPALTMELDVSGYMTVPGPR
jgi:hypothetical protein